MGWLHLQCDRLVDNKAQVSGADLGAGAGCHFCPLLASVSFPMEDSITYSAGWSWITEEDAKTGTVSGLQEVLSHARQYSLSVSHAFADPCFSKVSDKRHTITWNLFKK